jgi:tetratricopeptide (TPR) repeat protein
MRGIAALALLVSAYCGTLGAGTSDGQDKWADLHAKAVDLIGSKDLQGALTVLTRCGELAQTPVEIGVTANDRGLVLFQTGQLKEAKQSLLKAVDIWKTIQDTAGRLAQTSVILAEVDRDLGDYSAAEQLLRDALKQIPEGEPLKGANLEAKALATADLGDLLREEGRGAEARAFLAQVGELNGVSWRRLAEATVGLAELDGDAHSWDQSTAEWNKVIDVAHAHSDASLEAVAKRGLGQEWLDRGDPARAEPLLRSALATFESDPSANPGQFAPTLTCLAQLYLGENKLALAEDALTKALDEDQRMLGETNPQMAVVLEMLGDTLARRNQMDVARQHLDRAAHIIAGTFGEQSTLAGAAFASWGVIEQRANYPARAIELFQKALGLISPTDVTSNALRMNVLRHYAEVLKATHHKQEANAVLLQVKAFGER